VRLDHFEAGGRVGFSDADLRSGLEFREAQVGGLKMNSTLVQGGVQLEGTRIAGAFMLRNATVNGRLVLSRVELAEEARYEGATFGIAPSWQSARVVQLER
jgi:hypothetical protein